jgi:hypothetical protein
MPGDIEKYLLFHKWIIDEIDAGDLRVMGTSPVMSPLQSINGEGYRHEQNT